MDIGGETELNRACGKNGGSKAINSRNDSYPLEQRGKRYVENKQTRFFKWSDEIVATFSECLKELQTDETIPMFIFISVRL